jgi:hypothetical protein
MGLLNHMYNITLISTIHSENENSNLINMAKSIGFTAYLVGKVNTNSISF